LHKTICIVSFSAGRATVFGTKCGQSRNEAIQDPFSIPAISWQPDRLRGLGPGAEGSGKPGRRVPIVLCFLYTIKSGPSADIALFHNLLATI